MRAMRIDLACACFPVALLIAMALSACSGCAGEGWQGPWTQAKPETVIDLGPFHLHNSKDVTVSAKKVRVRSPNGVEVDMEDFFLGDNASGVRAANVQQIDAITNLTKEVVSPVRDALQIVAPIVGERINRQPSPNPVMDAVRDRAANTIRGTPSTASQSGVPLQFTPTNK